MTVDPIAHQWRIQAFTGVLLILIAVTATAQSSPRNTQSINDPAYLKPQTLVSVEHGRRINLYCTGKGAPTVIFDSGLGEDMTVWALVQPKVATKVRACSYDRAGLGFSDAAPDERTSAFLVADLKKLLLSARIRPPYVLVGHSFGGMNIKLYAETYPKEVAGLVFVDPSHEDLARRSWDLAPDRAASNVRYNAFLKTCLAAKPADFTPGSALKDNCATPPNASRLGPELLKIEEARDLEYRVRFAWISEQLNVWTSSASQLRVSRKSLGDMPLVVLTHDPLPRQAKETQEMTDAQNKLRLDLHQDIANMSSRGVLRTVHDAEHHFQLDRPDEVADAVLEVIAKASQR